MLTSRCAGLGNTGAASPASSPCGRGAAQFIVDTVNASPGEVTLLALASLTNIALALHLDPSIAGKLKSLLYLGGAFFVMGNVNPATEANVWRVARPRQAAPPLTLTRSPRRGRHDPEAADWVLGAFPDGVTRVVGLDVTTRSVMSGSDLDELRAAGGRFCEYAWSICQFYKSYHQRSMGMNGIFLHMRDVPVFAGYLMKHQQRRPPDHLVVEWFAGETPEAKAHKGARANVGFRHNMFDHIGTLSSLRREAQTSFPRCYELLAEPTVFQVEAFNPLQCPRDDIWPCRNVMGGVLDKQRLSLEGLGPSST